MKLLHVSLCVLSLIAAAAAQQPTSSANSTPASSPITLQPGTILDVELTKSLDAKKSKPGDSVEARLRSDAAQSGQVVIPRGTRIFGKVIQVQTRSGSTPSELGMMFEKALLPGGESVPLAVAIQAAAAPPKQAGVSDSAMPGSATGVEPMGRSVGQIQKTPDNVEKVGGDVGPYMGGRRALTSTSKGLFGMEGIGLKNEIMSDGIHSTFISPEKNVHLESGTELILRVIGK